MFYVDERFPNAIVADKDIKSWKVVDLKNGTLTSMVAKYKYELKKTYNEEVPVCSSLFGERDPFNRIVLRKGFSSFKTKKDAIKHWWRNRRDGRVVVRCTISKGTTYYKDADEYLSSSISVDCVKFQFLSFLFS